MDRISKIMLAQIIAKINDIDQRVTAVEEQINLPEYKINKKGNIYEDNNKDERTTRKR